MDKGSLGNPLKEQVEYDVRYEVNIPPLLRARPELPHCNVHSCLRHVGFCTPFVKNSPGLATHSPQLDHVVLDGSGHARAKSSISLGSGEYTIIAHVRWFDLDGIKHDMARATVRDVQPATHVAVYVAAVLGGVVGLAALLACTCGLRWVVKRHKQLVAVAEKSKADRKDRVARALQQTQTLAYPMCLIAYSHFKDMGKLITHEEARTRGLLRIIDTIQGVREAAKNGCIVFISHQWIGQDEPDFDSRHFKCICSSVEALQKKLIKVDLPTADADESTMERESLQAPPNATSQWKSRMQHKDSVMTSWTTPETGTILNAYLNGTPASQVAQRRSPDKSTTNENDNDDEIWLWIDYTSIPQRLATLQLLSIHSLFIYAGLSTYFLIVTPSVKNHVTGRSFDLSTYMLRGWCRLECWARFSESTDKVFVAVGTEQDFDLKPAHHEPSVFKDCLAIYTANFTDAHDKKKLVDTAVALYGQMFQRRPLLDSHMQASWKRLQAAKQDFFPRSYFNDLIEITEELLEGGDEFVKQMTSVSGTLATGSTCRMCNGSGNV
jgi:hypothetical protein